MPTIRESNLRPRRQFIGIPTTWRREYGVAERAAMQLPVPTAECGDVGGTNLEVRLPLFGGAPRLDVALTPSGLPSSQ